MPTGVAPPEPLQTEPTKSREIANKIEVIYLSLIDALPHAVTIFQDEQIVFANKTALDMFRLASPADLSELHPLQFVSEKDKERLEGYLRRRLAGDQDLSDRYETILCRSNGEEFPAEVRVKTFLFGGRIASQVVITDVTDRKAAEERLRLLAAVVEQCDEGIAVIDPEGHIAFLNFAFAGIHGYSPDELLNTHVATLYSSSNMLSLAEARWEMRQTGHFSGEVLHLRKDGTEAPVLANCCVLRDEEGAEAGFVIAVCEISHIKATEKLLRLSFEKAVSRASQMEDKVREVERDLEISQNKLREHAERLERSREALKMVLEQIQDRRERLEQDIYRSLTTTV
ncbi:MAG: PAS domain S-box protein, partial [Deltaproteobacteria bacterium]|nr:PAS domain S-box protein [Deltaproteobacteria bacterium]